MAEVKLYPIAAKTVSAIPPAALAEVKRLPVPHSAAKPVLAEEKKVPTGAHPTAAQVRAARKMGNTPVAVEGHETLGEIHTILQTLPAKEHKTAAGTFGEAPAPAPKPTLTATQLDAIGKLEAKTPAQAASFLSYFYTSAAAPTPTPAPTPAPAQEIAPPVTPSGKSDSGSDYVHVQSPTPTFGNQSPVFAEVMQSATDGKTYVFSCPWCRQLGVESKVQIVESQLACRRAIHAALKANAEPIGPHSSKQLCQSLLASGVIYGCGRSFQVNADLSVTAVNWEN